MYEWLLAVHILAAVLWVGGGAAITILARRAASSGDRQQMLQFSRDADWIGPRFYAPLSVLLLIMGILLVNEAGYEHSDPFVSIGYAGWVISFLIGTVFYSRANREREEIVQREGVESDAFMANFRRVATVSTLEVALLLAVVVAMAVKPGA